MSISQESVRRLMKDRGIDSIAELAARSKVNRTHIYNLWKRDGAATLDTLRKIARALRVPIGVLIGEEALPPLDGRYLTTADLEFLAQIVSWVRAKIEGSKMPTSVTTAIKTPGRPAGEQQGESSYDAVNKRPSEENR